MDPPSTNLRTRHPLLREQHYLLPALPPLPRHQKCRAQPCPRGRSRRGSSAVAAVEGGQQAARGVRGEVEDEGEVASGDGPALVEEPDRELLLVLLLLLAGGRV